MARSLVLQNLKALGSNPTEGEREFILNTSASLSQGTKVNEAMLNQMEKIARKQLKEGRFVAGGGDPLSLLSQPAQPTQSVGLSAEEQAELEELKKAEF